MEKKKILFVYYTMMIGGSTTSLLSLLNSFDYNKYDVDLLLYRNEGPLLPYIPRQVNLLQQAYIPMTKVKKVMKSICDLTLPKAYIQGLKYRHRLLPTSQGMAYAQTGYCRKIEKEYDVAIGFLELWSDVFVNLKVKAKKKISWIHVDYEKAHYIPDIDRKMLANSDTIVCVSDKCLESFRESFPDLADKCIYIPNILAGKYLLQRSNAEVDIDLANDNCLKLLSVCRLSIDHKGLDRGVSVISKLVKLGYSIKWYLIGGGTEQEKLQELISQEGVEDNVIFLGEKVNPYPYFVHFDAFFLPSRFEGKPMAVTEAQMLGLPALVTRYASAAEQVNSGVNGIICENNENGIFEMLKDVLENRDKIDQMKENVKKENYDNLEDIESIYKMIES